MSAQTIAKPEAAPESAGGESLEQMLAPRIARYATRKYDWDALKFQADFDPKYRRAQMRYIGTGGTGVDSDDNAVPPEHFTFSTMVLPPHCEAPLHVHHDVEEVFFMLRGRIRVFFEHNGEKWETELGERDLVSVPAGIYRGLVNDRDERRLAGQHRDIAAGINGTGDAGLA